MPTFFSIARAGAPPPEKCSENCTTDGEAAEKQEQGVDKPSPDTFMCDFRVCYQILCVKPTHSVFTVDNF